MYGVLVIALATLSLSVSLSLSFSPHLQYPMLLPLPSIGSNAFKDVMWPSVIIYPPRVPRHFSKFENGGKKKQRRPHLEKKTILAGDTHTAIAPCSKARCPRNWFKGSMGPNWQQVALKISHDGAMMGILGLIW